MGSLSLWLEKQVGRITPWVGYQIGSAGDFRQEQEPTLDQGVAV